MFPIEVKPEREKVIVLKNEFVLFMLLYLWTQKSRHLIVVNWPLTGKFFSSFTILIPGGISVSSSYIFLFFYQTIILYLDIIFMYDFSLSCFGIFIECNYVSDVPFFIGQSLLVMPWCLFKIHTNPYLSAYCMYGCTLYQHIFYSFAYSDFWPTFL